MKSMDYVLNVRVKHHYSIYKQNNVLIVEVEDHMQVIVGHVQVHIAQACQFQE
jgi:hypothetical protein